MCENGDANKMDGRTQDVHPYAREHRCAGSVHGDFDASRQGRYRKGDARGVFIPETRVL